MLLAGGCQVAPPRVEPPPLPADEHWQSGLPDRVSIAHGERAADDLASWWRRLGDDDLDRLISHALASSTDVRAALLRLRIAVLDRADSGVDFLPRATAGASSSRTGDGDSDTTSSHTLSLGASWELDLWGAGEARRTAAGETLEAVRQDLRDTRVSLIAETAVSYTDLRSAQFQLEVTRQNVAIQEQTLQFVQWQRQVGLATELEVSRARARLEQTRAQIPALHDTINRSVNRLQVLTGRGIGELREALLDARPLPALPETIVISVPADALRQRPDVRAAEHLVRARAAGVAEAQSDRFPSLTLSGDLSRRSRVFSDLLDLGDTARSLAAGLAYTVFDGGRIRRNVDRRKIELEQALLEYEAVLRQALEEAENALSAIDNTHRQGQALLAAEEAARLAAELASLQYESGLVDFQTVLDTQETLLETQRSLAANRGDLMTNVVQLYRALGGGWQYDAAEAPPKTDSES